MKKILSTMALLLLAVVALAACSNKQGSSNDKLRVVTTNSIIADITKTLLEIKSLSTVLSRLVRTLTNTNLFLMM